ncbi:hypothetical protein M0C34_19930 [Agarivorans sp. TSD2052]|uniref:hypothetical protein n=1 Tax=Agarivorans sp. TSD2052 TaxID=2937286 RepID=UPI00200E0F79|nr:hypothetical protein [Agarivorans sp. TSD2052]UPW18464.1 hypothetical protein M0C34_19930 [Agarivorans sp. TSD2052]
MVSLNTSAHITSQIKKVAVLHIIIGIAAMLLAYYVGTFSAVILGLSILFYAILGLWFNRTLQQLGGPRTDPSSYWLFLVVGLMLSLFPGITLGLAALCLGGGLIINGAVGFKALKSTMGNKLWLKLRYLLSIGLGIAVILAGANGFSWLIGMLFGLHLFLYGVNLWINSQQ